MVEMKGVKQILVTDNFLSSKNEKELKDAGYSLSRLHKSHATEQDLIEALRGKVGYVLGGWEKVTSKVLESAKDLKAIVYNSSGYDIYIDHPVATKLGIAIANCPDGDSEATAEYAVTLTLSMTRNLFDLGRTGKLTELKSLSLGELRVGIIGLGEIGSRYAILLKKLGVQHITYCGRTRHGEMEKEGIKYLSKEELIASSNVISVHTRRAAGTVLNAEELSKIEKGGLIINVSYVNAIDNEALVKEIRDGRLRAAFDFIPNYHNLKELKKIPVGQFFWSNYYTGWNTTDAVRATGDMATRSIINLLNNGADEHLVNPEFSNYVKKRA